MDYLNVIRLTHTNESYDPKTPWIRHMSGSSSGTGFVVEITGTKFILTNFHVIAGNQVFTGFKNMKPYLFEVEFAMSEFDLAILRLHKTETSRTREFWSDMKPIVFSGIPNKDDKLTAIGYPGVRTVNQNSTTGAVNRLSMSHYGYNTWGLVYQTDIPGNPGNSGGPVLNKSGECVGVLYSGQVGENLVTFCIPNFLVRLFFNIYSVYGSGSEFRGLCEAGIIIMAPVNHDYFAMQKIKPMDGAFVSKSRIKEIEFGDYIVSIDGYPVVANYISAECVARVLKYPDPGLLKSEYIHAQLYFSLLLDTDRVTYELYRGGIKKTIEAPVRQQQVPKAEYIITPGYLIFGYYVITTYSTNLMKILPPEYVTVLNAIEVKEIHDRTGIALDRNRNDHYELLLISDHMDTTTKHNWILYMVIEQINGVRIHNLLHLITKYNELMKSGVDIYLTLRLQNDNRNYLYYNNRLLKEDQNKIIEEFYRMNIPVLQPNRYVI